MNATIELKGVSPDEVNTSSILLNLSFAAESVEVHEARNHEGSRISARFDHYAQDFTKMNVGENVLALTGQLLDGRGSSGTSATLE